MENIENGASRRANLAYSPPLITAVTSVTQMCRRNGEFGLDCKLGPPRDHPTPEVNKKATGISR